jgi:guanosine-3',5'-bis(diphosphate) 3'-pyrophosphohydrolase
LEVARDSYFLNVPDFVLDFAPHEGGPKLVEVNAVETSSFYGADLEAVYRAWGQAVTEASGGTDAGFVQTARATADLLEKAILLATKAHSGQVDKAGQPYILHALRVMLRSDGLEGKIVGVLHDVVEDTPVTLDDLWSEGFPENIIGAVDALTKRDGESRFEAAMRAVEDPLAREVKLADNTDNMDLSRIANPMDKDRLRLEEYAKVRKILESVEVRLKSARDLATEYGGESLLPEEDRRKNHFIAGLRSTRNASCQVRREGDA